MNKTKFRDTVLGNLEQTGITLSKKETGLTIDTIFDTVLSTLETPGEKVTLGGLGIVRFRPTAAKPATIKKMFGEEKEIKAKPATLKPNMRFTKGVKQTAEKLARTKKFKEYIASNGK